MLLWKNTKTLDGLIDDIPLTDSKSEAELVLLGSKPIDLKEFPRLKGIFRAGVSKTNVPIKEAKARDIQICFPSEKTQNYIYEETANFTCGIIFKQNYSNLGSLNPWIKYNRQALSEKRLLIVGEGRIGGMVKHKMSSFLNIDVYDPIKYPNIQIESLLTTADIVTLHIPDMEENIRYFDSEKLGSMKRGALLINISRGRVVDEDALYDALKNNRIKAVFDVFWEEPYDGKLKEFYPSSFGMTPHVASTCNEFLTGSANDLKQFIYKLEQNSD